MILQSFPRIAFAAALLVSTGIGGFNGLIRLAGGSGLARERHPRSAAPRPPTQRLGEFLGELYRKLDKSLKEVLPAPSYWAPRRYARPSEHPH
jgi:hypothetical protein